MSTKIGTLNLCLGLANKKELVKNLIYEENIDVLCLQETELANNLDHHLMNFPNYRYESEINDSCSRVGYYLKTNIS
jgi:exonuclease III